MRKVMVLTSLILSQMVTSMAWAGIARFDSSQFNDMIIENQKQEKELRHKLQNEAGIDYKLKRTPFKINRKEVPGDAAEQVAVSSGGSVLSDSSDRVSDKSSQHAEMQRLSQELDQEGR